MDVLQIAGRHSTYATQFFRGKAPRKFASRQEMRKAESKKALERRLVIPFENKHWVRALEVLNAGYARPGRTPEHFQRTIRLIVECRNPAQGERNSIPLNTIRDALYEGKIPSSVSLWQTLVWAYAQLQNSEDGLECFHQAQRRCKLSSVTQHQMATLLFPVVCHQGKLMEAKMLLKDYILNNEVKHADGSAVHLSNNERAALHRMLAEAAARSGSWVEALSALDSGSAVKEESTTAHPTINTLFDQNETPVPSTGERPPVSLEPSTLQLLSKSALRSLLHSFSQDGERAMLVFRVLHSEWRLCGGPSERAPPMEDLLCLANALGHSQMFVALLELFSFLYLKRSGDYYLELDRGGEAPTEDRTPAATAGTPPMETVLLNMVFASFPPKEKGDVTAGPVPYEEMEFPRGMAKLLDDLLWEREDVFLTDLVVEKSSTALVQVGEWERALHLLRQAPLFQSNKKKKHESVNEARTRQALVNLLYHIHGVSTEAMCFTLQHFPFIFPPEVFAKLPPLDTLPEHFREVAAVRQKEWREKEAIRLLSDEERLKRLEETPRKTERMRKDYFKHTKSATALTESAEKELSHSLAALQARAATNIFAGDAERDPRPIPKGIHDRASGWNYFGRGGEMMFANSKKTAHPYSMWPKQMRALANPYRSWNPKLNSSYAHRENVKKWSGKSAV
ncbi:hypothetical protein AGDE_14872 [Angomonas deanei]|nr:hypothetical protein AGDE_14872 [Angomonas deanei]|eukprot:EPY20068.1 hypothetical protein AGDE_14872 [Angomonas deanei]